MLSISLISVNAWSSCNLIKPKEFALLPKYCKVKCTYGNDRNNPEASSWGKYFGWENYVHLHHYCFAISFENRANSISNYKDKVFAYNQADRNYAYVLDKWEPGFILLPEVNVKRGKLLEKLGRQGESFKYYTEAVKANIKYSRGYAALSDWHKKYGKIEDAKKVIEDGLKVKPKSRMLIRRLKKLNNKN